MPNTPRDPTDYFDRVRAFLKRREVPTSWPDPPIIPMSKQKMSSKKKNLVDHAVDLTVTTKNAQITANGEPFITVYPNCAAMEQNSVVGSLGFADGIAYIRTQQGWVNMGEALSEKTDRRGAIMAQRAKRNVV